MKNAIVVVDSAAMCSRLFALDPSQDSPERPNVVSPREVKRSSHARTG